MMKLVSHKEESIVGKGKVWEGVKAGKQLWSYWAHLHIKHYCEVEITHICNNIRHT